MAYFDGGSGWRVSGRRITQVICDACLRVEEITFFPMVSERGFDTDHGLRHVVFHPQQNDPWCWTPRWSMKLTLCSRCGCPVDKEPKDGWEPRTNFEEFCTIGRS